MRSELFPKSGVNHGEPRRQSGIGGGYSLPGASGQSTLGTEQMPEGDAPALQYPLQFLEFLLEDHRAAIEGWSSKNDVPPFQRLNREGGGKGKYLPV